MPFDPFRRHVRTVHVGKADILDTNCIFYYAFRERLRD